MLPEWLPPNNYFYTVLAVGVISHGKSENIREETIEGLFLPILQRAIIF